MPDFEMIESMFLELLATSTSELSESERQEVRDFIDVGEYGLALETAADIFAEEKKTPSAAAISLMKELALAMSMNPESLLDRLHNP
jgi:hypothetical protein